MNIKQILPWIIHVIFYCLTGISLKIIGNSLAKYEATSSVLIFHSFKLKLFSTLQTMLCCSAEGSAKYCFFFIQLNHQPWAPSWYDEDIVHSYCKCHVAHDDLVEPWSPEAQWAAAASCWGVGHALLCSWLSFPWDFTNLGR